VRVRADLREAAAVDSRDHVWIDSPLPGVTRVLLDRVGEEVAVATSLVRYAPGSRFDPHVHGGGEEFLVLDGVFSDEHGDYPAGTYVRNPIGTRHQPFSRPGCVLFVKLWQFHESDDHQFDWSLGKPPETLFEREGEIVGTARIDAGGSLRLESDEVQEVLVLDGELQTEGNTYGPWSWLRWPARQIADLRAAEGCTVFHKTRPVYRNAVPD
jgi:hypothetical protein